MMMMHHFEEGMLPMNDLQRDNRFGKVLRRTWRRENFKELSITEKLILNYLWSHPDADNPALIYCPPEVAADDLGLDVRTVKKHLKKLTKSQDFSQDSLKPKSTNGAGSDANGAEIGASSLHGLQRWWAYLDKRLHLIYLPKAFELFPPYNLSVVVCYEKAADKFPNCPLKSLYLAQLQKIREDIQKRRNREPVRHRVPTPPPDTRYRQNRDRDRDRDTSFGHPVEEEVPHHRPQPHTNPDLPLGVGAAPEFKQAIANMSPDFYLTIKDPKTRRAFLTVQKRRKEMGEPVYGVPEEELEKIFM
ncbi:MAG: helix-turn-helix domain-containing protein [Ammonifex sp.]|jgi:hypothetical protein|nr:MAG: helix-turn-helix domain-containing protein [Ammonifex sp.]